MAKERKSPQQKKQLEYTKDHFTFGWHSSRLFPKGWKLKKAHANRSYRHKSEQLLAEIRHGIPCEDADSVADDLTAARFQKSVSRERLRKVNTVTVGEKIKRKLERRAESVGWNVKQHQRYERKAASAIAVLSSLKGAELADAARRANVACNGGRDKIKPIRSSNNDLNRAIQFVHLVATGSHFEVDALRRKPQLAKSFRAWVEKANRILEHDERARQRMLRLSQRGRKKLKALRKDRKI